MGGHMSTMTNNIDTITINSSRYESLYKQYIRLINSFEKGYNERELEIIEEFIVFLSTHTRMRKIERVGKNQLVLMDVYSYHTYISTFIIKEDYSNVLTGIFDLQMSLKSDHMNSIMKTLTLVSVIFIPMTFIAGLYGMNFENMPELTWNFGYGLALVVMFGIGISIALFFRSKGWWGKRPSQDKRNK